jgi:hypothetical protein
VPSRTRSSKKPVVGSLVVSRSSSGIATRAATGPSGPLTVPVSVPEKRAEVIAAYASAIPTP